MLKCETALPTTDRKLTHRMTATAERLSSALIDRYAIERELGAGVMATVYLSHDHNDTR